MKSTTVASWHRQFIKDAVVFSMSLSMPQTFSFLSLTFTLSSLLVGSVVALCYVNFLGFRKIERVLCGIEGEAVEP